jgi:hypothetical protein
VIPAGYRRGIRGRRSPSWPNCCCWFLLRDRGDQIGYWIAERPARPCTAARTPSCSGSAPGARSMTSYERYGGRRSMALCAHRSHVLPARCRSRHDALPRYRPTTSRAIPWVGSMILAAIFGSMVPTSASASLCDRCGDFPVAAARHYRRLARQVQNRTRVRDRATRPFRAEITATANWLPVLRRSDSPACWPQS